MFRFKLLLFALGLIISGPYLMITRAQAERARNAVLTHGVSSTAIIYGSLASSRHSRENYLLVRYRANDLTQENKIAVSSDFYDQYSWATKAQLEIKYLPSNPAFGVFPGDESPYTSTIYGGGIMFIVGIIAWIIGWRMDD